MLNKNKIKEFFSVNSIVYGLLKDSSNPREARSFLTAYINETRRLLNLDSHTKQSLEFILQMSSLYVFRRIISVRSERLTKYSIIKLLWDLANENTNDLPEDLSDGFIDEMTHLFRGMMGKTGIYDKESYPDYIEQHGKKASVLRSEHLDKIGQRCIEEMNRYPSGLDDNIIQLRDENKKRILDIYNATETDWQDYHWHLKHVIRTVDELEKLIHLSPEEKKAIRFANKSHLPFGITPYYVSLMDNEPDRNRDNAVRSQVIPPMNYVEKMVGHKEDREHSFDFMMEHDTSPVDLITRRYPMIAILKPYNTCSQICVYCQRNWEIEDVLSPDALPTKNKLDNAIQWLADHPVVTEVLVTGGDPLVMNNKQVDNILSRLAEIKHIERIRIGSRIPVVMPMRINNDLLDLLAKYHVPGKREVALVTHFEHTYEVTPEAMEAVQHFKNRGISVYNQAVFTVANSRRFELTALRKQLRLIGVDPYYTFNTKGKEETKSYRVPLARLQQEVQEEARLFPGLVRTDEPVYNVPKLGKNYIRAQQHKSLITILPDGRRVYEFHPWEKNLSLADTYIDIDVSISEYLKELQNRGENIDDYKTIWYYF